MGGGATHLLHAASTSFPSLPSPPTGSPAGAREYAASLSSATASAGGAPAAPPAAAPAVAASDGRTGVRVSDVPTSRLDLRGDDVAVLTGEEAAAGGGAEASAAAAAAAMA